jgi:predicted enzyme related to lactoylglutathione lyase
MAEPSPSLAGVIIWTEIDRFQRLVDFYKDTLGLRPVSERADHVAFASGDVRLTIGVHAGVSGAAAEPFRIMINLSVADIHREFARLRSAGIPFLRVPAEEPWGGWIATLADPDGNTVQLLQLPQEPA